MKPAGRPAKDDGTKIRKWLIDARKKAGLTQQDLAWMSGITQETYSYIERGRTTPKASTAMQIAEILQVPWTRFYVEDGKSVHVDAFPEEEER